MEGRGCGQMGTHAPNGSIREAEPARDSKCVCLVFIHMCMACHGLVWLWELVKQVEILQGQAARREDQEPAGPSRQGLKLTVPR